MRNQMSYKAKRKVIVIAIIVLLAILVSVGTFLYIQGNNQTQAVSEMNGTSDDKAGEDQIEQAQIENENNNSNDSEEVQGDNNQQNDNLVVNGEEDNEETVNSSDNTNSQTTTDSNDNQVNTQTITTTENVETTNTVVGFEAENVNLRVLQLNAKLPNIESKVEAVTKTTDNYVATESEILYNIIIKNNGDEKLQQINVSAMIPEGTELVEDSISDDGILENGTISWKVDIDTEKTVSFTVKVKKTSGEILASAIVNGKETNTVTNVVDEAPVLNVVDSNKYQMEIGTEYQEKGYSAIDKEDGDITDKVVLSYRFQAMGAPTWENPDPTELDTNRLGVYKITYTVTDSRSNTVKGTRVVEIVDTQAPELEVEQLRENGFVNTENTQINVKDISSFTTEVFDVNGKLLKARESQAPNAELKKDTYYDRFGIGWLGNGTFTVRATDISGNVTEKTFTVDSIAPEISVKDGSYINTNISPRITEANLESATISFNDGNVEEYPITNGIGREISREGKYTITLTDKAGNATAVTFVIDKTAPNLEVEQLNEAGYVNTESTQINVSDANPFTTEIFDANGKLLKTRESQAPNAELKKDTYYDRFGIGWLGEGTFTVKVTDKAGNVTEKTFTVDTTAPSRVSTDFYVTGKTANVQEIDGKKYQFFYAKNGEELVLNIKFKEELVSVPTFTLIDSNGNEYVLDAIYDGLDDKGSNTYTARYEIKSDEANLAEGEITFRISNIVDKAGNKAEDVTTTSNGRRIIYDRTNPEIKVKEESIGNAPYFSNVSFKLSDNVAVKEFEVNEKVFNLTPNTLSDANFDAIEKELVEGKNIITLRDMAGNEVNYEFYFDNTPARRSATNILVYGDSNDEKEFYAKVGDTIQAYISFNEKLAHNPKFILINDGKEYEVDASLVTAQEPNKDGKYIYQILYKIEEDTSFVDGEITLKVTDLEDMYGNKISDETKPTNGHRVFFDKTAPVSGTTQYPLFILNRDDKDHRKYIGDGDYLRVEANFDEMLAENPVLTIGTAENTQTVEFKYRSKLDSKFVYVADIKINNNILKLADGTIIPFTVTNIIDLAGNETTLNNDNVTPYKDIYDQVTYDNTAPVYEKLGILNKTHYVEGGDLKYATTGDEIRILVNFKEKLAVSPKIKINDDLELDCFFAEESSNEELFYYMADFKITKEMNLPEDEIQFEVYGYEDEAGNEGAILDNGNINREDYSKTIYDITAPKPEKIQLINNSNPSSEYIKDGETIRINATFSEELEVLPTLTVGNKTAEFKQIEGGNGEVIYQANLVINASENTELKEGKLQFTISGYEDKAGNKGENISEESARNSLIFDRTAPIATFVKIQNSKDKDTTWAKKGEDVWVYVIVNEKLSVEPTFTIAGKEVPIIQREDGKPWGEEWYKYAALLKMTEDISEGNVEFKVSGYVDMAGNIGADITATTDESKIIYDKTAPKLQPSYWRKTVEADKNANFTESLYPEVYGEDNLSQTEKVKVTLLNNTVNMGVPGEYKLQYVTTDEAGNEAYNDIFITVEDKTAPKLQPSYWRKTVEADKTKEFTDFPEVSGTDNAEGTVTVDLVNNTVNMGIPGEYKLQYVTTDANGNKAYNDIFITVEDTTKPEFKPSYWRKTVEADKTKEFTDFPETDAVDNAIGDIVIERVTNNVNLAKPGEYKVGYKIKDASGNITYNDVFIIVEDTTKPTIALKGEEYIELEINTEYKESGLDMNDNAEGKLITTETVYYSETGEDGTWKNAKGNKVDTSVVGYYNIWYTVTDESGNSSEIRRRLKVQDTVAPTISLKGEEYIEIEKGTEYKEPGLNMEDNSNGKLTITETVYYSETGEDGTWKNAKDNKVDTSVVGYYNIWYTVTDESGNSSEIRRRLKVQDTVAPEAVFAQIKSNNKTNTSYAKVGDDVWVYVKVNEELSVEPTITIAGKEVKIIQRETLKNGFKYVGKLTMTDEMEEGNVEFKISGYKDLAGNTGKDVTVSTDGTKVTFDKTAPTATVEYSITEPTNRNVMVTIKASEPITLVDDDTWEIKADGAIYQKAYPMNTDENIEFIDNAGNKGNIHVKINNIDKKGPTAEISQRIDEKDPNKIWVTFKFNEKIDESTLPQGMLPVADEKNTYVKAYFNERNGSFKIKDILGNESEIVYTIEK